MTATEHIRSLSREPGRFRVAVVLGTRPEAIKLAPVVHALQAWPDLFEPVVIATSQQREMLAQAMAAMQIRPDVDLGLTHANRTLAEFTAHAMLAVTNALMDLRPGILLVQGDTSTVAAAALSAFYQNIAIGHVEAGLRSGDMHRPFPEEANRRIAALAADLHFAPTARARDNLVREGAPAEDVYVTGNTVVDALAGMPHREHFDDPALESVDWTGRRVVLVTVHRRESLGDHLHDLCRAFKRLVHEHPEVHLVFPVHLNPRVREVVFADLRDHERITLLDPLSYPDLLEVMRRSHFVMSDSGGIQEETPSFRKPILILRTVTERPEVIEAGFGTLVGTDPDLVVGTANRLLRDETLYRRMTSGQNPFGDGAAAARIIRIIAERFGLEVPARVGGAGAA